MPESVEPVRTSFKLVLIHSTGPVGLPATIGSESALGRALRQECPAGIDVTQQPLTGAPPSLGDGPHETLAVPLPRYATLPPAGGIGAARGTMTGAADSTGTLAPLRFVATTPTEYSCPYVSPSSSHDRFSVVHDAPPGDAVAV